MEVIAWTEALSIGVERIDEEHKAFVAMLNGLGQAIAGGQGQGAVAIAVDSMREYALKHFKTEEEAMSASRYPGRTSHVAEHDSFIERVLDLESVLGEGQMIQATEIWNFLRSWLEDHILVQDKPLGAHLCACGKG